MKLIFKLTIVLLLFIQSFIFGQTNNLQTSINKKYSTLLLKDNKGIGLLIKKDNQIKSISLGNFNLNAATVFNIGSATKTFTAILLLQEVEKGNIKLTDSIGTYLSPIQNVDSSLSVGTLLKHESGLDEVIGKNIEAIFYSKNDSIYNSQLLHQIEKNNPKMIGKYNYCNTNYFLLGKIIEKITDRSYFDLLRERIFIPLKMKNTHPYVHKNIPNLATPYHKGKDVSSYLDYRYFANIAYAAGSIASTLSDMELFYSSLFETELLLKKETLEEMMISGSEFYGLGLQKFSYNGKKYYGHGGNNIGYSFRNAYNPVTKNMFLIFTNSHRIPLKSSLKSDLFGYLNNKEIVSNLNKVTIANFKSFIGTYLLKEANITLEIIKENDAMYLVGQGTKNLLVQKNATTLYETSHGVDLERVLGDTSTLKFTQNGYKTTIKKTTSKK